MKSHSTAAPPTANRVLSLERYHSRHFSSGQGPPARKALSSVLVVSRRISRRVESKWSSCAQQNFPQFLAVPFKPCNIQDSWNPRVKSCYFGNLFVSGKGQGE